MNRILFLIAAAAATLNFGVPPAYSAYIGNAPWCAVVNIGSGDVEWDCEYGSIGRDQEEDPVHCNSTSPLPWL